MKLHALIATLALTVCSVTQAEIEGSRLIPPSPWEKVDLICFVSGPKKPAHKTFYRHPSPGKHYWIGVSDDGYVTQYWSDDDTLTYAYSDENEGGTYFRQIAYNKVDRMTGEGRFDFLSNYQSGRCQPRPANKF